MLAGAVSLDLTKFTMVKIGAAGDHTTWNCELDAKHKKKERMTCIGHEAGPFGFVQNVVLIKTSNDPFSHTPFCDATTGGCFEDSMCFLTATCDAIVNEDAGQGGVCSGCDESDPCCVPHLEINVHEMET